MKKPRLTKKNSVLHAIAISLFVLLLACDKDQEKDLVNVNDSSIQSKNTLFNASYKVHGYETCI